MTNLTGTYNLDPAHSSIGFTVRHAMVTKVRGEFTDFDATLTIAENPAESTATGTVRTASVDTKNADRDEHVRGDDFFAVDKYPEMTFNATEFNVDESGNGSVTGDLTIKGTTSRSRLTSKRSASRRIRSATPASASRHAPPSTARTSASTSRHR